MSSPIKALEAFADPTQNPDLLRLESMLKRFNLFEAIGVIRQELRHSDFLACLLDPNQSHGLGTRFLDKLLYAVLANADDREMAYSDLKDWNLSQAIVTCGRYFIDILVLDENNHFAVIIENKVDSGERSGQLQRYYELVGDKYPGYEIVALYLTRDGDAPTFDRYIPVSYSLICRVVEKIVEEHRAGLGSDIVMLLEHYVQMLRRHIVSDSDVAILSRRIYRQHKQALDTIFEHIGGQEKQIWDYAQLLIQQTETVYLGESKKRYMTFGLHEWKAASLFTSPPHLYFEFQEFATGLRIYLTLSPGDPAYRARLFEVAQRAHFPGCQSALVLSYCRLASISILHTADYGKPQEEIEAIIAEKWAEFLNDDLPHITETIRQEKWLWEALPPGAVILSPRDQQAHIGQYIKTLVENNSDLKLYNHDGTRWQWLNFTVQDWDTRLKYRQPGTNYAIFPYLSFHNSADDLKVALCIGPGSQMERQKVLQMATDHGLLGVARRIGQGDWIKITAYTLLGHSDYEKPLEEIEAIISEKWAEYLRDELPRIVEAVRQEKWLWELPS